MQQSIQPRNWKFFPSFIFLLPIYFIAHNAIDTHASIKFVEALQLFFSYLFAISLISCIFYWLTKSLYKATLAALLIMSFYLFFGGFHDTIKELLPPQQFFTRYIFLLPFLAVVLTASLLYLLRKRNISSRIMQFFNLLFVLLLLIDIPAWNASLKKDTKFNFDFSPIKKKPDVYLIVADEYADSASLQEVFGFNNRKFLKQLRDRGFDIIQSKANYNFTPFCISSILSMSYLKDLEGSNSSIKDMQNTSSIILDNPVATFFKSNGYELKNFSIFNFADIPSPLPSGKREVGIRYIRSQTLYSRLERDLAYHFVLRFPRSALARKWAYFDNEKTQKNLALLKNEIRRSSTKPRFIYTHLLLPHYPYFYDSAGKPFPVEFLTMKEKTNKNHYLQYLKYGNNIFIDLIDQIIARSKQPPIIILMGDHGFREFENANPNVYPWYYTNHNSIYLPGKDFSKFYPGISGVNQFRTILNTTFNQNLPILPDSSIFLLQ